MYTNQSQMKIKEFINKLLSYNYNITIYKNNEDIYDGDLKNFIGVYSEHDLFNEKICGFYFCRTQGIDKIVIHTKEGD